MPFITEELWGNNGGNDALITSPWPSYRRTQERRRRARPSWTGSIRAISAIRAVRSEMNVPPAAQLALQVRDANATTQARLDTHRDLLMRLARLSAIDIAAGEHPKGAVQVVLDEATFVLPLAGVIDVAREQARLQKEIEKTASEISKWTASSATKPLWPRRHRRSSRNSASGWPKPRHPEPSWPRPWSALPRSNSGNEAGPLPGASALSIIDRMLALFRTALFAIG